jgi:formylglycine-generating enzyme required for sulfatase activity
MRMTAVRLVPLVLIAAVLATCGPAHTEPPAPAPTASALKPPPSPVPTPTPTPAPEPTPGAPGDTVSVITGDRAGVAATLEGTSVSDAFATPFDTWVRPADGMTMVRVPGGTFPMGSADDDPDALPDEVPQHRVTLDSFWIDQTEVTNGQYVQFLNEHGNSGAQGVSMIVLNRGYTRVSQVGDEFGTTEASLDRPVLMVTWHGAAAYCEWAGGRLPTEAEWEYAARGPEGNLYPWGNAPPTCDLANYGDCNRAAARVGSRPAGASWCGALDMAGNVWEWVADWYGPYTVRPQENPTGPATGDIPVLRGGGWHSPRWELRAAYRQHEVSPSGYNG